MSTLTAPHDDLLVPSAERKKKMGKHSGLRRGTTAYGGIRKKIDAPKEWEKGLLRQGNYILALEKLGSAKSHTDMDLMKNGQGDSERFPTSADTVK